MTDASNSTTPGIVNEYDSTIPQVLERSSRLYPSRPAIVDDQCTLTYDELRRRVRVTAAALVDVGIEPGDTVAMWGHNSTSWAVASLGVLYAGAVVVPVNFRYTPSEAGDIIERSRCRTVFADGEWLGRDRALEATGFAPKRSIISLTESTADGIEAVEELVRRATDKSMREVDARVGALTAADLCHIQFTSGTTGRPKGAMLRHGAMTRTTADWVHAVGLSSEDRYPVVAPFSHIGGHKTGLLACITAAAALRPIATLDVERLGAIIDEWQVTVLQGPPTMFQALLAHARQRPRHPSSVRIACTGAATVPPQLVRDLWDELGVTRVVTSYGLTEATGVCTITGSDDTADVIAETSGAAIPGVEVRIVDAAGRPVSVDETGEIVVRGHNLMAGYLDDAEATAEAIRDGWLHTGDVGALSVAGNLRIVDRLKDMIIVGGFNVYPAEVEHVLLEHPAVLQAAVIGIADERMGEVPAAFIVSAPDRDDEPDALVSFCESRLAKFKVPRTIVAVEALPQNAAGKVSKAELRRTYGHS